MGKFPEQEPILCHGIHHPRDGEDGTYEAIREEEPKGLQRVNEQALLL